MSDLDEADEFPACVPTGTMATVLKAALVDNPLCKTPLTACSRRVCGSLRFVVYYTSKGIDEGAQTTSVPTSPRVLSPQSQRQPPPARWCPTRK